jgi:uncharacterized RDD family membrane protein YckC
MAGYSRRPDRDDTDVVGARVGAQIVDNIVTVAALLGVFFAGMAAGLPGMLSLFLGVAVGGYYMFLLEGAWDGKTLGKHLFGIKVVTEDGSECGYVDSLVRNVLQIVDGFFYYAVGLVLMASSDKRQRLGDRVADTVVVPEGG